MKITIPRSSLRGITEPLYRMLRDTAVRMDIYSDALRFRANAKSQTFYFDQSIPIKRQVLEDGTECRTYWIDIENFWNFQNLATTDDITIRFQNDTEKTDIQAHNAGLNFRFAETAGDLIELPSPPTEAEFSLPHSEFKRAVSGSSAVGDKLRISVQSKPNQIQFSANLENRKDDFRYIQTPNHIETHHNASVDFLASTRILKNFVNCVYPADPPDIKITSNYLSYHAKHPTDDAKMDFYIAERAGKVPAET